MIIKMQCNGYGFAVDDEISKEEEEFKGYFTFSDTDEIDAFIKQLKYLKAIVLS